MDIVSRKENKLLNRVEIDFRWQHEGQSTPSRKAVMDLVRTLEPGSNPDCIVVKECNTRFGQPLTTGKAFIYADVDSMTVEPEYIHKRHEQFRSASPAPAKEGGDE
jgi:ribosomal protein S24E